MFVTTICATIHEGGVRDKFGGGMGGLVGAFVRDMCLPHNERGALGTPLRDGGLDLSFSLSRSFALSLFRSRSFAHFSLSLILRRDTLVSRKGPNPGALKINTRHTLWTRNFTVYYSRTFGGTYMPVYACLLEP